ncbi:PucR family transcriptional regulator [Sphaerisporangium album]|uniref:PucR family transcriptional regulator n=1 Tax=Sphaerisporangium album TaxID=509200 RepID=A0A367FF33_9ACTN|nr:PucR family transcriptional regulator [Sphaerisporangium album]RCG28297.1 PucR family transcriptional regulator [Sphaerisporangium album]
MEELLGRLTALDPIASEGVKIITYFDALVQRQAGLEALIRGAAILAGSPAGFVAGGRRMRVTSAGARTREPVPSDFAGRPSHAVGAEGLVWLEREDETHANDEMILERAAIALGVTLDRLNGVATTSQAVETLLDPSSGADARKLAAVHLRLRATHEYRVLATPAGRPLDPGSHAPATRPLAPGGRMPVARSVAADGPHALLDTTVGILRATIVDADAPANTGTAARAAIPPGIVTTSDVASGADAGDRLGIGEARVPALLHESWAHAVIALRLTNARWPAIRADDLGVLADIARLADAADLAGLADVKAVGSVVASSRHAHELLESIAVTGSLRSAAADAGLHHSTVQAKAAEFSAALGYDLRTPAGRVRLTLALTLWQLASNRFD